MPFSNTYSEEDSMSKCLKDGFCVAPRKENEIRAAAEQFRKILCDHDDIYYLDITRLLEFKIPKLFPGFRYEIVEPDELPGREAEMNPFEYCIRIQEPVYIKAMNGDGHGRFTIAHEIGHFIMHRTQTLAFGRKAQNGDIPSYMNSEWQADVFARNLLAPFSLAHKMIPQAIETVFGVSRSVAEIIAGKRCAPVFSPKPGGFVQMTLGF